MLEKLSKKITNLNLLRARARAYTGSPQPKKTNRGKTVASQKHS